ncbi:GIY-YIG nuclease family protein [Desulfatitalea tepidiphila]|uniref:GIY-YIG nuclease family protein n=1 Tax=Desulfatitalea tepidiphila TaxID=1185843 RepID=UPI0006B68FCA|nr:GIY-YIG nuclease family protein [Desulfatitalea tepidiphila]
MVPDNWVVYLLRCADDSLYCGITKDLEKRLSKHNSGKGAKYTRSRLPLRLVGVSSEMTKSAALKLEYRLKRISAADKIVALERLNAD